MADEAVTEAPILEGPKPPGMEDAPPVPAEAPPEPEPDPLEVQRTIDAAAAANTKRREDACKREIDAAIGPILKKWGCQIVAIPDDRRMPGPDGRHAIVVSATVHVVSE